MLKRIKSISKYSIEGMVCQIRYLVDNKKVSDEALAWHLQNILLDKGIPVDYIPRPAPWDRKKNP